jgi:hypothetical protein
MTLGALIKAQLGNLRQRKYGTIGTLVTFQVVERYILQGLSTIREILS